MDEHCYARAIQVCVGTWEQLEDDTMKQITILSGLRERMETVGTAVQLYSITVVQ